MNFRLRLALLLGCEPPRLVPVPLHRRVEPSGAPCIAFHSRDQASGGFSCPFRPYTAEQAADSEAQAELVSDQLGTRRIERPLSVSDGSAVRAE